MVIENGINAGGLPDDERATKGGAFRRLYEIPTDALLIGTLGDLSVLKGQREFVLAANEVAKSVPNAYFIVVGRDQTIDKSFRRELKRLVKVFGIEDRFLFLDWVEDTESFYSVLDLFVSASHTESFGLAILEAMASGSAVVATDTEGAKLLLDDASCLVPTGDAHALSLKMSEFAASAEMRKANVERLRIRAREEFGLDRMIDETAAVYKSVLGEK